MKKTDLRLLLDLVRKEIGRISFTANIQDKFNDTLPVAVSASDRREQLSQIREELERGLK